MHDVQIGNELRAQHFAVTSVHSSSENVWQLGHSALGSAETIVRESIITLFDGLFDG